MLLYCWSTTRTLIIDKQFVFHTVVVVMVVLLVVVVLVKIRDRRTAGRIPAAQINAVIRRMMMISFKPREDLLKKSHVCFSINELKSNLFSIFVDVSEGISLICSTSVIISLD